MGSLARYVDRLAALLRGERTPSPAVGVDADGVHLGDRAIAWHAVRRIEAFKRDAYVGDCLCLAILADDGRLIEINDATPGWDDVGAAIERYVQGSMPRAEWMVRLIATSDGQSVAVHRVP